VFTQLYPPPTKAIEDLHAATAIYTAKHVISSLLDRLNWPNSPGRLLDPSAGDGAFLIEAIKRLDLSSPHNLKRIKGWEIHPVAAAEARSAISRHLQDNDYPQDLADQLAQTIVINKDFLIDGPIKEQFDTIAGNPPYLCFRRFPPYFKKLYGSEVAPYARADILYAFLDSCSRLLAPGGQIGFICSDRFLINDTTSELRRRLGDRLGIAHLSRVDQKTAFYRPKRRIKNSPPRIHPIEIVLQAASNAPFRITENPLSLDTLTAESNPSEKTLADIATVTLAPWLGPEGIFIIEGQTAQKLRDHAELIPAVDTDDIDSKTDQLTQPYRYVIKTDPQIKPSAQLDQHLRENLDRMPPRGRRATYWLAPETPRLSLDQPRLLIPRIARQLRAIELPAGVMPINHNLSIVSAGNIPLSEIKEILLSQKSQDWIKATAPRLENGYLSITTKRLRRLPI
jgi:tRNA1(Val) A37 N6-methylase TrmN6